MEAGGTGATSVMFANAVRALGQAARLRDLVVPSFRSPPSIEGVHRSIRRRQRCSRKEEEAQRTERGQGWRGTTAEGSRWGPTAQGPQTNGFTLFL